MHSKPYLINLMAGFVIYFK